MRSVLRHFSAALALLVLAAGLLLASAVVAGAHAEMPSRTDTISIDDVQALAHDAGAPCTTPTCQSDHSAGCCHMTGPGCSTAHAICNVDAALLISDRSPSTMVPHSTPILSGLVPPVAQRPPVALA